MSIPSSHATESFVERCHVVMHGELETDSDSQSTEPVPSKGGTAATKPESVSVVSSLITMKDVGTFSPAQLLMAAAVYNGQPASGFYKSFKSKPAASAAFRKLESDGYLDCPRISSGGKGGKLKIIRLTKTGWDVLAPHGIQRPPYLVQGGDLHDFAARAIRILAIRNSERVKFEVPFASIRLDVIWYRSADTNLLINIGVSDPQREADALQRALTESEESILMVGVSKRFNEGVARRLKAAAPHLTDRVSYRLVGALIKRAYLSTEP